MIIKQPNLASLHKNLVGGARVIKVDYSNVLSIEDLLYQKHPRYDSYLYKVIINVNANDIR